MGEAAPQNSSAPTAGSVRAGILKAIGPGILFAGAAIGGSHLVWSTKAGALYGWSLLWVVLAANLFKYPFFEFFHRYTAATGQTILEGYQRQGRATMWIVFAIAAVSGIMNIAGVTVVTAGLAGNLSPELFPAGSRMVIWSAIIGAVCVGLLFAGRYPALDRVVKVVVATLAVSTVAAVVVAAAHGANVPQGPTAPSIWNAAGIGFLIALMGWMPAPVDVGIWPSLWCIERGRQTRHRASLREARIDFHIGYLGTAVLAVCFLGLGALVMFGTGETPRDGAVAFASQLVGLYTATLGPWSWWLIAIAALSCMFSTTITCFDGYTRTVYGSWCLLRGSENRQRADRLYWGIMLGFFVTTILIAIWIGQMMAILKQAATVAFLTAPLMGWFTLRAVRSAEVPASLRPGPLLTGLAWAGLVFLVGFSVAFILVHVA